MKDATQGQKGARKRIEAEELLVLHETAPDDKGRRHKVRVVRWSINGAKQAPKLEKRGFFRSEHLGTLLTGQPESFTLSEVRVLSARMPEILRAMEAGLS